MTEQSVKLSGYATGEILSAKRKADNNRPKGDERRRNDAAEGQPKPKGSRRAAEAERQPKGDERRHAVLYTL